ncbi:DNA polymerase III subunit delta [Liquorilactobacillus satsumensis]|uniref:DNA polymerase III subunit delta n=1 Tax=Liquorilactobacillus satsumensis DSM 16230 = JCM 12392 TaxID=1423801 RepID=A0A0R1V460_9LACO|nr:DNA polymerase III subunit delta [Liquorilactobacillus satsumensis]KRL99956.1 DNA polymerase III subunit delta [Liquorilactobacillus satsumensis DSM 16230 = JCM 12392]MCC7665551.1 DNA polymerase III subunit delta [Liquorilactobacillus satsumensis]MCP9311764.1 DNA polymerase III subunit delta [Liquorilactobacillus satsumensis]MCP9328436.1 DNA polymerase III subunit delta [Liquorilactobacillus satsumensis]MCP9357308.1 DNA polymerase III subunit delta [Liquorilactobacillus satsumensis]
MKVNELFQSLKQKKPAAIYVILGREEYTARKILQSFVALVPEEQRTVNVGEYDMETTPLTTALEDALSAPFFGERRVVLIKRPYFLTGENKKRKIEQHPEALLSYLDHPEPTSVVVFWAPYPKLDERKKVTKRLLKKAVVVDNDFLNERSTRAYLKQQVTTAGYTIEKEAFELLLKKTENQLSLIMNELPKLFLVAQATKKITGVMVERMVAQTLEQNIFDLSALVLDKKVQQAVVMYHNLLEQHEEPLKLNAILVGQVRLLLQVSILQQNGYAQGNIASVLKTHPYRVKLALQKCRRFGRAELRNAYLGLIQLEEKMKSTQQNPQQLFELFMLGYFTREKTTG